jgi:hypothetical protein
MAASKSKRGVKATWRLRPGLWTFWRSAALQSCLHQGHLVSLTWGSDSFDEFMDASLHVHGKTLREELTIQQVLDERAQAD